MRHGLPAICTAKTVRPKACRTSRTNTIPHSPRKGRTGRTIPASTSAIWWTARRPATGILISGRPGRLRWKSAEPEKGSSSSGTAGKVGKFPASRSHRRKTGRPSLRCSLLKAAGIPSISPMRVRAASISCLSGLIPDIHRRPAEQRKQAGSDCSFRPVSFSGFFTTGARSRCSSSTCSCQACCGALRQGRRCRGRIRPGPAARPALPSAYASSRG